MKSKKFVKIRGVNNLSDARYCSGMMVNVIGFNLDTNRKDGISIESFKAITKWIQGPQIAGEFDDMELDLIHNYLTRIELDVIETSNPSFLAPLLDSGKEIYLKINLDSIADEKALFNKIKEGQIAHKIVICSSGKSYDKPPLKNLRNHFKKDEQIINGFNLDLNQIDFWPAIEIIASPEGKTGYKDYGEVMDILEHINEQD
tara:strand:- start:14 stop:619 length:606 start_codon:yes stop_codon:yes gene_type:complete